MNLNMILWDYWFICTIIRCDFDYSVRTFPQVTQASPSRSYALLATLLDSGRLEWEQPVEGRLVEARTFSLEPGESRQSLLQLRNNDISFLQADIGARVTEPPHLTKSVSL